MKNMITKSKNFSGKKLRGFTLIELMIVVLIVAIIAAVAVPSYSSFIVRSNRGAATDLITQIMFQQERAQTRQRTYTTDLTSLGYVLENVAGVGMAVATDEGGLYGVTAGTCADGSGIADCVLLTATPRNPGPQQNDGILSLDSRGNRVGLWEGERR